MILRNNTSMLNELVVVVVVVVSRQRREGMVSAVLFFMKSHFLLPDFRKKHGFRFFPLFHDIFLLKKLFGLLSS